MQLTKLLQEIVYTNPQGSAGRNIPSLYIEVDDSSVVVCKQFRNLQTNLKYLKSLYMHPNRLEDLDNPVHIYGNLNPITDCALISISSTTFLTGSAFSFDTLKTLLEGYKDKTLFGMPLLELDDLLADGVGESVYDYDQISLGELLKDEIN